MKTSTKSLGLCGNKVIRFTFLGKPKCFKEIQVGEFSKGSGNSPLTEVAFSLSCAACVATQACLAARLRDCACCAA